jgi:hypothetical protein
VKPPDSTLPRRLAWVLALAASMASTAFALQTRPTLAPEQEAGDDSVPPTLDTAETWVANDSVDPVTPVRLGTLKIVFEKTTLAQVRERAGSGTVFHHGDAAESLNWLCYALPQDGFVDILWLSSSEMADGTVVDGLTAFRFPTLPPQFKDCSPFPRQFAPARLADGTWLGTSASEVRRAYGSPRIKPSSWEYFYEGSKGKFDITSSLAFKMEHDTVVGIDMGRVTSQ